MVNRQIKTCRKKRHVRIDNMKEMPKLICSNAAVGGNFKSTRDNRASFYVCRLVSSQKERDFSNTNYDDIKCVHSICLILF